MSTMKHPLLSPALFGTFVLAAIAGPVHADGPARSGSPRCPLSQDAPLSSKTAPATPEVARDRTCLATAADLRDPARRIFDLRSRGDYLAFHAPRAEHASVSALVSIAKSTPSPLIAYDSGKFTSDAFLLCQRLRNAGVRTVKIVDGGIAGWAQVHEPSKTAQTNRLSDAEMSAAVADGATGTYAMTPRLREVLKEHGVKVSPTFVKGQHRIVVADTSTPMARIQALMTGPRPVLYWIGGEGDLVASLHAHYAQDRKRVAGPAESSVCGSL